MRNKSPNNEQELFRDMHVNVAFSDMVLDHINVKYTPLRSASEYLARATGVSPATARNWLRRMCVPQADNLGELIRNDPEFREKLRRWVDNLE